MIGGLGFSVGTQKVLRHWVLQFFSDELFGSSAAQSDGKRQGPARSASGSSMSERVEAR